MGYEGTSSVPYAPALTFNPVKYFDAYHLLTVKKLQRRIRIRGKIVRVNYSLTP